MNHGEFEVKFTHITHKKAESFWNSVFFPFPVWNDAKPFNKLWLFFPFFSGCIRFFTFFNNNYHRPSSSIHPFTVHVAETVWGILSIIVLYLASLQSQKPPEFDPVPQHRSGKGWMDGWCYLAVVDSDDCEHVEDVGTYLLLLKMIMLMMMLLLFLVMIMMIVMMMILLLLSCCWWRCCLCSYFVDDDDDVVAIGTLLQCSIEGDDVGALLFVLVLQLFLMFWGWWSWWWWGGEGGFFYFISCSDTADDVDDVVVGVGDVCWAEVGEVIQKYGCIGYHCFFADARLDMIWYGMIIFYLTHFDTARNNKARSKDGQPSSKSRCMLLIFDVFPFQKYPISGFHCMFVFVEVHGSEQVQFLLNYPLIQSLLHAQ